MTKETEKFLKVEESSDQLLVALNTLHAEANSYKTSKEQLEKTRSTLVDLISETEELVKGTFDIVTTLKAIGGPEILGAIGQIAIKIDGQTNTLATKIAFLKKLVLLSLAIAVTSTAISLYILYK